MMKTRLQRTELLRAARVLSTPKRSATMCLMVLLTILIFPTKTWAQKPIAKIGDTTYESLETAFKEAADGSTVTLLDNADLGENLIDITAGEGERNLTFDLNGRSLIGTDEPLYVRSGVNITIKGGTIGGPDADNPCGVAIRNIGGKVSIENLTISNCRTGIYNEDDWPDEETSIPGELTIGSGVNISATERCIDHFEGELTLTALPILSWGEDDYGIALGEGNVINFAGEGITALPEDFKPIRIWADGELPRTITNGYADHVKSGSEAIDPAKVFVGEDDNISMVLYEGEAVVYSSIQKVSVTKGDEVKQYLSLQTAFNKALDGSTVTLLDNADLGGDMIDITAGEGERNLTFDLKGFSLTGTDALLYVYSGVNITVKGGTIGGPDADNPCGIAIRNIGGKVSIENLTISNCRTGIYNEDDWPDEETSIPGELTIGSGVNISATERCIDHFEGELTLTTLPMLSWDEGGYGITLSVGQVINFAGESITALPKNFKPIEVLIEDIPSTFTSGYSTFFKNIDPADVFVSNDENIIGSITLEGGEAVYKIEKVSFPEGLSTFFSVCDLSVDNKKVKIYTVTAIEEGKVTVAEVKSKVIPSYTPVIISNESSETLFDPIFLDGEVCQEIFDKDIPDGVAPEFCGTNGGTHLTNEDYDFYGFDGRDFVRLKDGGKVAPHRCWIEIPNENYVDDDDDDDEPVAARQLNIAWPNGDTTSVQVQLSTVDYRLSSEVWYKLDGCKLESRPTQKGIYIKKGKKVAIK